LSKNVKIRTYKTIILPALLHGCETWSLGLRKERRLRVLRIFGPKRDEVTGHWRKLHNEELHNLYSSPSIIRMIMSVVVRAAVPIKAGPAASHHTLIIKIKENKSTQRHCTHSVIY
jgi:hypothetical protein